MCPCGYNTDKDEYEMSVSTQLALNKEGAKLFWVGSVKWIQFPDFSMGVGKQARAHSRGIGTRRK